MGVAASAVPQYTKAAYPGLAGQSVGVMVWADQGVLIDWGTVQLDLANAIQNQLQQSQAEEVKGVSYPVEPRSIVKYQRDHPAVGTMPVTDIAPNLGVSRLIYVELAQFRTRSEMELELFRGSATASLKVVAIDPNGVASIAYAEDDLQGVFPDYAPTEGLPNVGDRDTYHGLVQTIAREVVKRLTTTENPM